LSLIFYAAKVIHRSASDWEMRK